MASQSGGPSGLARCMRVLVAWAYYWDIDLVNAHPCLVAQLPGIQGNAGYHPLQEYVDHRADFLDEVEMTWLCTPKQSKNLFICLLNGGTIGGWAMAQFLPDVPELRWPPKVVAFARACDQLLRRGIIDARPDLLRKVRALYPDLEERKAQKRVLSYALQETVSSIPPHSLGKDISTASGSPSI